ncbi:MAG: hypothetical protein H6828_12680 [Planctomycetes bacterium]|nr:hypothetical protein [Planctomycetota bacterium]
MRAFALLQLPLVYLPLCVYGLGVYGSDFDAWSGRLFLGLLVGLLALEALVGRRVARLAGTWAETAVGLAAALVAGVAYAPLHLGWWDEHATSQAAGVCALGLLAWSAARLAAAPRDRALAPREVAGALVLVGLVWSTAWLYPLLPLLALGVALGLGAAVRPRPRGDAALEARFGGFEAWAAVLLGVDLFLGLWDGRWIATWAAPLGLAFALAGLRVGGRQQGGGWIVIGALNFAAAALWRAWGPHPLHVMLAGFALGGLLHYVLGLGRVEAPARRLLRAPLGGFTVFWVLGVVLGLALYQNLAFAPWRLVLLLPALLPARHREPALPAA